jgi:hypothetical protein
VGEFQWGHGGNTRQLQCFKRDGAGYGAVPNLFRHRICKHELRLRGRRGKLHPWELLWVIIKLSRFHGQHNNTDGHTSRVAHIRWFRFCNYFLKLIMPFIIYPQDGNKLAIIIPTGDVNACIKDVPAEAPYAIVESLEGIDNDYFDAFVYEDGKAVVDISKAKLIHLDKFRKARSPKLAKLDVDYMKAIEVDNSVAASAIAVRKQELRDVTKTPLPDTLAELKSTWPEILN